MARLVIQGCLPELRCGSGRFCMQALLSLMNLPLSVANSMLHTMTDSMCVGLGRPPVSLRLIPPSSTICEQSVTNIGGVLRKGS